MVAGESTPVPDPTILTTEAMGRGLAAERDYVDGKIDVLVERLRGIDTATELLNETVNRVPTDVTKEVTHLRELMAEQFRSVATQFGERDTRSERESRDNKVAVDAAFAAQKEAAAKQDEANAKAIDKSEKASAETVKTNQELATSKIDALADRLSKLELAVSRVESLKQGGSNAVNSALVAITGLASVAAIIAIIIAIVTHKP